MVVSPRLGSIEVHVQVRIGARVFPVFFPVIIGSLIWAGLYLRDDRLQRVIGPATSS